MKKSLIVVVTLAAALGLFAFGCSSGGSVAPTTSGIQTTSPAATSQPATTPPAANVSLTVTVEGGGQTTPAAGKYTYPKGTVITLTAIGDVHWEFNIWLGSVADTRAPLTTITLNSDQAVTAYFSATAD